MPPTVIPISRYPNRRLYDRAHSRHVTHDELYDMVAGGATIQVTDSATGQDITSQTLMQLLIERDPLKLASVPPEVMHLLVRSSDAMLRSFFAQAMQSAFQTMFAAMPGAQAMGAWPFAWPGTPAPGSRPPGA